MQAEDTQVLASVPWLEPGRLAHENFWIETKEGIFQKAMPIILGLAPWSTLELEILQSEEQTERWQTSWRWVVQRGITWQPLDLKVLVRTNNLLERRPRIRIPRWRLLRKKKRGYGFNSSAAAWQMGGKKNFFQVILVGTLTYQVPAYFLSLKPIRIMLESNLESHRHQMFFPNHQATGVPIPLILQIRK
jgi:hypothetical protein